MELTTAVFERIPESRWKGYVRGAEDVSAEGDTLLMARKALCGEIKNLYRGDLQMYGRIEVYLHRNMLEELPDDNIEYLIEVTE